MSSVSFVEGLITLQIIVMKYLVFQISNNNTTLVVIAVLLCLLLTLVVLSSGLLTLVPKTLQNVSPYNVGDTISIGNGKNLHLYW